MAYFYPKLETELIVDGLPAGLGAILTQLHTSKDGPKSVRIVAYASRSLDDEESRYSQAEREALAVRWAIEHFHLYLFGTEFTVLTDHKPLVSIFSNVTANPSATIQRWCLCLQQYTFNVMYKPGSQNPADYMSQHPVKSVCEWGQKIAEEYLSEQACPKAVRSMS